MGNALRKPPENFIHVIAPYWADGTWVFDDASIGLVKEPFISGVPEILSGLVSDIPNAKEGFRLLFSEVPFPGYQADFAKVGKEFEGVWYQDRNGLRGWLSGGVFKYFTEAPETLYVRVEKL